MGRIYKSHWAPEPLYPKAGLFEFVWRNKNNVPDSKPAIIYAPTGEQLTRKELRDGAQKLAHGLRYKLGLKPGDVFCLISPNTLYYTMIALAGQCAGVVVSPANAAYTATELAHQVNDSGSTIVMCAPGVLPVVLEATSKWENQKKRIVLSCRRHETDNKDYLNLDDLFGEEPLKPHVYKDPTEELAYMCYSSGTTGVAKGVMTTVYNMTSVLSGLNVFMGGKDDISFAFLPLSHIYGMTKLMHLPVQEGQTVVIVPKWELESSLAAIQKYKPTLMLLVPPVALLLATEPIVDKYDISSLTYVMSGAAPLGLDLQTRLQKRLNCYVTQGYGLTESSPTSHYSPYDNARIGSAGKLLPNVQGRIVDPVTMKDMPNVGDEGEIWMKGPIIMKGYKNRPEATAETLVEDHWLRTGDIGKVDEDGYFYITDRIKELIKYKDKLAEHSIWALWLIRRSSLRFQVPPAELEAVLLAHPAIADSCVVGVWEESQSTELPLGYVVLNKSADKKPTAKEIQDWVAEQVAPHKRLRGGVRFIDVIPKSPSGKILRRILREQAKKEGIVKERQAKL